MGSQYAFFPSLPASVYSCTYLIILYYRIQPHLIIEELASKRGPRRRSDSRILIKARDYSVEGSSDWIGVVQTSQG